MPPQTLAYHEVIPESVCLIKNSKLFYPHPINQILDITLIEDYVKSLDYIFRHDNSQRLNEVIRADHINTEERIKIISLCKKYFHGFFNLKEKLKQEIQD